ncbi:FtsW/RodA/SpoVE family cell cycle protein [Streptococcus dentiloxodontae]
MFKSKNKIENRIEYSIILPVLILLLVGLVAVYIATSFDYPDNVIKLMIQQVLWILLGAGIAFVVMFFNTEFLWKITPWLYGFGLGLMILPLIFFSPELVESTGAKNWVSIGSVTLFQPSEFMKISYILMLSRITVTSKHGRVATELRDDGILLGKYILVTIPVLLLLALQKDLGTAMVFMAILAGLVLVAGISWKIILPIVGVATAAFLIFLVIFMSEWGKAWLYGLGFETYKINRILAWLDPFTYANGIAYQQTQGMIAIGSGGVTGKGFNVMDLNVPVRESDMIFTVIAEDFGLIGSGLVLLTYLFLIYRMLRVTFRSNNRFYTFISTGFIMMIVFHIFENVGATLGLLPLTGIPLPFISQGGSSLISNLIGVGLVLSMAYQTNLEEEHRLLLSLSRRKKRESWKYGH